MNHKKVLVVDNYDSFVYNLVHLLRDLGISDLTIARNDKISVTEAAKFDKILLSPGPGIPNEAGIMPALVRELAPTKSIFGVCLGHQCIGEIFGGTLINMGTPVHGRSVSTEVIDAEELLFRGVPQKFLTGRYHSWLVAKDALPQDVVVTAVDDKGDIMALRHRTFDVRGVQFHPESVLTEHGAVIVKNWLEI